MNESRLPPKPGPRPRPGGQRTPVRPPQPRSAKGRISGAVIGRFLEEIDFDGSVNPETLQRFAPLAAAAGTPGGPRWQLATDLTREALDQGREAPSPGDIAQAWEAHAATLGRRTSAFLEAIGHTSADAADSAVVSTYAAVLAAAGEPGSPQWGAAVRLVAGAPGKRPPQADKVAAEIERVLEGDRARAEERRRQVRTAAEQGVEAAQAYVRAVRAETGAGPTWYQLARHLGVRAKLAEDVVRELHELGAVTSTPEPRSLDVP